MARELSLIVVGALHPNADGSNRLFEIRMLNLGDGIRLALDPTNKADPSAVSVHSSRGYQIGYLSADRCGLVGGKIRQGQDVRAIFQQATRDGAVIRVHLDGQDPTLPPPPPEPVAPEPGAPHYEADPDSGFWPDYIPPDEC